MRSGEPEAFPVPVKFPPSNTPWQMRWGSGRDSPLMPDATAQRGDLHLGTGSNVTIAALGVVFGDIGTSPLYSVRQSLVDFGDMSEHAILGALSLIVWALVLIVTVKYVLVIMRADNRGEGGLLALTALVLRRTSRSSKQYMWIMAAGLVGVALFYGDGVITPAISVLSAIEGTQVAVPSVHQFVMPMALIVLTLLFAFQHRGTAQIGSAFGPIMLVWFLTIAVLGAREIARSPSVLRAAAP